ncbi:hypothetical protein LINGRAHAP2_LOCUS36014 [Linum grandiflorum]
MAAATVASSLPSIPAARSRYSSASSSRHTVRLRMPCRAMVQQAAQQGAPAAYAKEMERLSAKESLLLAFKDAGGFESLVTGKTTEVQKIDVNERITGLERLNPTPRPTTCTDHLTWKADGISSGLELVALDYLLQDSCFRDFLQIWLISQTWMW